MTCFLLDFMMLLDVSLPKASQCIAAITDERFFDVAGTTARRVESTPLARFGTVPQLAGSHSVVARELCHAVPSCFGACRGRPVVFANSGRVPAVG